MWLGDTDAIMFTVSEAIPGSSLHNVVMSIAHISSQSFLTESVGASFQAYVLIKFIYCRATGPVMYVRRAH